MGNSHLSVKDEDSALDVTRPTVAVRRTQTSESSKATSREARSSAVDHMEHKPDSSTIVDVKTHDDVTQILHVEESRDSAVDALTVNVAMSPNEKSDISGTLSSTEVLEGATNEAAADKYDQATTKTGTTLTDDVTEKAEETSATSADSEKCTIDNITAKTEKVNLTSENDIQNDTEDVVEKMEEQITFTGNTSSNSEDIGAARVDETPNVGTTVVSTNKSQSDVTGKVEGPLGSCVHKALDALQGTSPPTEEIRQEVNTMLVTAYCELSSEDRLIVDDQLADILFLLTKNGIDVNVFSDVGKQRTPLHEIASVPDSSRFIRALHAAGAKINVSDYRQQTALHLATKCGEADNVRTLVDCGANINQKDAAGKAPLHLASAGRRHLGVMQSLVRCRADVGLADAGGRTALHVASRSGRVELVRELIVHGKAGVYRRDEAGMTPIHIAAMYDVTGKVLAELLRHKTVNVHACDTISRETPLHKAVRRNMLENIVLLIRCGADPNMSDALGYTAMHRAAQSLTDLRTWNALMNRGGDVNVRTSRGLTVRSLANKAENSIAKSVIAHYDAMADTS